MSAQLLSERASDCRVTDNEGVVGAGGTDVFIGAVSDPELTPEPSIWPLSIPAQILRAARCALARA